MLLFFENGVKGHCRGTRSSNSMLNRFSAAFQSGIGMFDFWLILLSAKEVRILRPHRAGPAAGTIHMEIQRGGARVNAQWGVNMQQRIIHIKFRMDQAGLSVKDLEPMIGQPNRVYEVLSHKRPLTLRMIRNLNKGLGISAEVLITDKANTPH